MSTAGRKPSTGVVAPKAPIDGELMLGDLARGIKAEAEARESALTLASTLGYDGSLDPDILEAGIQANQQRVQFEMFEAGKRLLILREQCSHGDFMNRLERLDIEPRAAQKFMLATMKFSNAPTSAHLEKFGKSKLLELIVLDEDETTNLMEGKSVRGVTLDDIDCMTVRELRRALREADARIEAKDRVAADNQAAMQRLQEQIASRKPEPKPAPDFLADTALRDLDNEVLTVVARIEASLRSFLVKVSAPELEIGPVLREQAIHGAIGRVLAAARDVAQDFGVAVTGAEAADGQGEWDGIWKATLDDVNAGQRGPEAHTDNGDATEA